MMFIGFGSKYRRQSIRWLCVVILILAETVCVEGAAKIRVTPTVQEIYVKPGESQTQSITLTNQGEEDVYIQISLVDWMKDSDGESIFMQPGTEYSRSNLSWLKVEPRNFYLAAGAQRVIRITMEAPQLGAGSYWSMMVFEFFDRLGARPFGRLAIGVYGLIEPLVKEAEVIDMKVSAGNEVEVTLKNTGNTHLRCTGEIIVTDGFGDEVTRFPMDNALIFPGMEMRVKGNPPGDLSLTAGKYSFLSLIDYGGDFYIAGEKMVEVH